VVESGAGDGDVVFVMDEGVGVALLGGLVAGKRNGKKGTDVV
jgi:hypothetical protein